MIKYLTFFTGILICIIGHSQENVLLSPSKTPREQIIKHKAFTLSYSSAYVVSNWVSYKVTNQTINKDAKVKAKYTPDPEITTRSAEKKDYKDSGFLMAQLCNYLDVMHIEGTAEEAFYMSNIVPMKMAFHKHSWLKAEDLIRLWVKEKEVLQIIAGVNTKESPFPTFGNNKVAIPKHFYKIVYDANSQEAFAFYFKNGMASGTLKSFVISIDKLEAKTGIDYFPELNEDEKTKLKSSVNYDFWNFVLEEEL